MLLLSWVFLHFYQQTNKTNTNILCAACGVGGPENVMLRIIRAESEYRKRKSLYFLAFGNIFRFSFSVLCMITGSTAAHGGLDDWMEMVRGVWCDVDLLFFASLLLLSLVKCNDDIYDSERIDWGVGGRASVARKWMTEASKERLFSSILLLFCANIIRHRTIERHKQMYPDQS